MWTHPIAQKAKIYKYMTISCPAAHPAVSFIFSRKFFILTRTWACAIPSALSRQYSKIDAKAQNLFISTLPVESCVDPDILLVMYKIQFPSWILKMCPFKFLTVQINPCWPAIGKDFVWSYHPDWIKYSALGRKFIDFIARFNSCWPAPGKGFCLAFLPSGLD